MLNNNIIYNEMMIHIPMCTHNEAKKVLVVGAIDDEFKTEIAKHTAIVTYTQELNVEDVFDVIIYTGKTIDELIMSNIDRCLNQEDGIFVMISKRFNKDENRLTNDLNIVGKNSWISMPYSFGHTTAIIGSKKYHPQADIILDRSDFLDCQYYNTELHNACFVYPTYIQKALTGIAKR